MRKKNHHYIPQVYLRSFVDAQGMVQVYRKDDPDKEIRLAPKNVAFHKFYYSQPTPEGGVDDERLENLFSEVESRWPDVLSVLKGRVDANSVIEPLMGFVGLQRVRVPAARDVAEATLAAHVRAAGRSMDAQGLFPAKPVPLLNVPNLWDELKISIDPHRSIHAMPGMLIAVGELTKRMGFAVIHNGSGLPFLTSDNPVCWYDVSVKPEQREPYVSPSDGPIEFIFPLTPSMLLYGATALSADYARNGLTHMDLTDADVVRQFNETICRFGYQAIFAQAKGQQELIRQHCDVSPVPVIQEILLKKGVTIVGRMKFDKRQEKAVWRGESQI
ncbi:DUF4238 domain-containing protein [Collimonas sp. OK412]|uniref:DUF4238 domain-containing protein n=1 Tax=Collimonas sp. (strain OK412) TaxID=1801619 RepID=UPI0008EB7016|nr:DUF4238 domain-containing protein [Collimonas sp. OK412]SFC74520.1 Protein of unknown function [Collimonas sp. OK412]